LGYRSESVRVVKRIELRAVMSMLWTKMRSMMKVTPKVPKACS
jgi:hypothetical protein